MKCFEVKISSIRLCFWGYSLQIGLVPSEKSAKMAEANEISSETTKSSPSKGIDLIYGLNDTPPWYLCIILGFQVSN